MSRLQELKEPRAAQTHTCRDTSRLHSSVRNVEYYADQYALGVVVNRLEVCERGNRKRGQHSHIYCRRRHLMIDLRSSQQSIIAKVTDGHFIVISMDDLSKESKVMCNTSIYWGT